MDALEGIHSVRISSSPPSSTTAAPGYEVLRAGRSGIAVYSSAVFFGTPDTLGKPADTNQSSRQTEEEGCIVGR